MITERDLVYKLEPYLPPHTAPDIARLIVKYSVRFRITMPRNSVYGDYMHPHKGDTHRITVNGNLNAFAFLVTTIHEFAHLVVWTKHRNYPKPHGEEWKYEYKVLMQPFFGRHIFPMDVEKALRKYMHDPGASSCSDTDLMLALRNYDRIKKLVLEDVPEHGHFFFQDREFVKGRKLRTRYECREVSTNIIYLIGQTAEITLS